MTSQPTPLGFIVKIRAYKECQEGQVCDSLVFDGGGGGTEPLGSAQVTHRTETPKALSAALSHLAASSRPGSF